MLSFFEIFWIQSFQTFKDIPFLLVVTCRPEMKDKPEVAKAQEAGAKFTTPHFLP